MPYIHSSTLRSSQDSTVTSFSSAATSSVREASGNASNNQASDYSSAESVPGRLASQAVLIVCLRQMKGFGNYCVLVER